MIYSATTFPKGKSESPVSDTWNFFDAAKGAKPTRVQFDSPVDRNQAYHWYNSLGGTQSVLTLTDVEAKRFQNHE